MASKAGPGRPDSNSQIASNGGRPSEAAALRRVRQDWQALLHCRRLNLTPPLLLCWLDEAVEAKVDATWPRSPSWAYRLDALAAAMCMAALRRLLPAAGFLKRPDKAAPCAPLPPLTPALQAELVNLGLSDNSAAVKPGNAAENAAQAPQLKRRYAVLAYAGPPENDDCAFCVLRRNCPRRT